jgi:hypothetical protein
MATTLREERKSLSPTRFLKTPASPDVPESGAKATALQTLREIRRRLVVAPASGLRAVHRRYSRRTTLTRCATARNSESFRE